MHEIQRFVQLTRLTATMAAAISISVTGGVAYGQQSDADVFKGVTKHLDLGGEFFGYINVHGDFAQLAELAQGLYDSIGPNSPLPPNLDIEALLKTLGFNNVTGIGASSMVSGDGYRNRAFIGIDGERQGLLRVGGEKPSKFTVPQFAPANAVVAFEQELNTVALINVVESIGTILEPSLQQNPIEGLLAKEVPGIGLTVRALVTNLTGRVTAFATIVEGQFLQTPPHLKIPAIDLVFRHSSGDRLFEPLQQLLAQHGGDVVSEEGDGFKRLVINLPDGMNFGFYQPVIHLNTESKELLLASRPEALATAGGNGPRLATNQDYLAAMKGLPEEGNQLMWMSKSFFQTYIDIVMALSGMDQNMPPIFKSFQEKMMEMTMGEPHDAASVSVNLPEGVYIAGRGGQSFKHSLAAMAMAPAGMMMGFYAARRAPMGRVNIQQEAVPAPIEVDALPPNAIPPRPAPAEVDAFPPPGATPPAPVDPPAVPPRP